MQDEIKSNTPSAVIEAIQKVAVGPNRGRDLSRDHACEVMRLALADQVDDVQLAVFLIALRMKRESIDEFHGLLDALSERVATQTVSLEQVLTLAEPFDGYVRTATVTPFIPAVLAACGLNVVMHGVESVGPKHGVTAHKVYAAAGMRIRGQLADDVGCLQQHGWCYVAQEDYCTALYRLSQLRNRIVKRTALTTLERVAMPIKGKRNHLALAYVHKAYPEIYAAMAFSVGFDDVLLFKGVEGGLAPALNKPLRRFQLEPGSMHQIEQAKQIVESHPFGHYDQAAPAAIIIGDPVQLCLNAGLGALSGELGIARDSLCFAAANILWSQGACASLVDAVENVRACLDNGSALASFNSVVEFAVATA